jgi:uncharacterized protein (DUF983 family)
MDYKGDGLVLCPKCKLDLTGKNIDNIIEKTKACPRCGYPIDVMPIRSALLAVFALIFCVVVIVIIGPYIAQSMGYSKGIGMLAAGILLLLIVKMFRDSARKKRVKEYEQFKKNL